MKGVKKRSKTFFKAGHTYGFVKSTRKSQRHVPHRQILEEAAAAKWCRRLTRSEFELVVKTSPAGVLEVPDADGVSGSAKILRPRPDRVKGLSARYLKKDRRVKQVSEMRLLDKEKNEHMWNACYAEHSCLKNCTQPSLVIDGERKWGLCWQQRLKCRNCSYQSKYHKLYEEVSSPLRGVKAGAPNRGLQVGLQESTCGNTKARVIIAATNTPPPCRSAMQKQAISVAAITSTMTEDDLRRRRVQSQEINSLRGLAVDTPINISVDVRYNSNTITSRRKMGQNASQAIGIAVEQQTDRKQIVSMYIENKLCWEGAMLRSRGFKVKCPGHEGCSSTITEHTPLSEKNIGMQLGLPFAADGINVKHVVTDGDARSAEGIQEAMRTSHPCWITRREADTTHLGQSQFRHCVKAQFSKGMFNGKTADERKEQQKILGLDIKTRCHAIYSKLHMIHCGDAGSISAKIPKVVEATLLCYSGDCKKCRRHSLVCDGGKQKCWWNKSVHLHSYGLKEFNMTRHDEHILRELLLIKLGKEALQLTKLNQNTNKNEGINRGISASLPKNVNFSRTCKGRLSASVDRLNWGAGDSLHRKLEACGTPVTRGGRVSQAINSLQKVSNYDREHFKLSSVRARERKCKQSQIQEHYTTKKKAREYKKHQLDPKPRIKTVYKSKKWDHMYSKL
jgi:hypothetical protein